MQLEPRPFTAGHINIVPHAHVNNLEHMTKDMQNESMNLIIQSCHVLSQVVKATDFNIGFHNNCPEKHFRWDIIPSHQGDVSCTEVIGNIKVISRSIEQLRHELCEQFNK